MSTVEASATADAVEAAVRTKTYSPRTIPVFGVVTQHEDSQVPPGCSRGGEGREAPGQPGGIQDQSEPAGTETRGAGPWGACGWRWGGLDVVSQPVWGLWQRGPPGETNSSLKYGHERKESLLVTFDLITRLLFVMGFCL